MRLGGPQMEDVVESPRRIALESRALGRQLVFRRLAKQLYIAQVGWVLKGLH